MWVDFETLEVAFLHYFPRLFFFAVVIFACVLYLKRSKVAEVVERIRNNIRFSRRMRQSALFEDDLENGLSSRYFDITGNLEGDSREGLNEAAKTEIRNIMTMENISFDEARLRYFRDTLSNNGVGSDGVPTDLRTVTFDRL